MFHEDYTYGNNQKSRTILRDPLNLKRCMRFYPQDDNQGGFFVAVFEKLADMGTGGQITDKEHAMDAWSNKHVR